MPEENVKLIQLDVSQPVLGFARRVSRLGPGVYTLEIAEQKGETITRVYIVTPNSPSIVTVNLENKS
jgi:hypothetical protein